MSGALSRVSQPMLERWRRRAPELAVPVNVFDAPR
jgi:hypothetical protein